MKFTQALKAATLGLVMTLAAPMTHAADKTLVVATDTAFVPFEFKQDGKYTGFDIQLWEAIAKQANLQYKLQPMDFNGIIPGLQTKSIDAALAGGPGHPGARGQHDQDRQGPGRQDRGGEDRHRGRGLHEGQRARRQAQAVPEHRQRLP